jgi:hypothetical protein
LNKNIQELFSAIANEDFRMASNIIKSGKVGIECEDHSRATPLIAVCRIPKFQFYSYICKKRHRNSLPIKHQTINQWGCFSRIYMPL